MEGEREGVGERPSTKLCRINEKAVKPRSHEYYGISPAGFMDKMSEWQKTLGLDSLSVGISIIVNDMSVEEMALCTCENSTTAGLTRLHCGTPLIV